MTRLRHIAVCLGALTGAGLIAACYQDVDMDVDPIQSATRPAGAADGATPPAVDEAPGAAVDNGVSAADATVTPGDDIAMDGGGLAAGDDPPPACAVNWTMFCSNGVHLACEKVDVIEVTVPSWPPHAAINNECPGGFPIGMNCDVTALDPSVPGEWREQFEDGVNCTIDQASGPGVTAECYLVSRDDDTMLCHNNLDAHGNVVPPKLPPPGPHGSAEGGAPAEANSGGEDEGQDTDGDGDYDWDDIINDLLGR